MTLQDLEKVSYAFNCKTVYLPMTGLEWHWCKVYTIRERWIQLTPYGNRRRRID